MESGGPKFRFVISQNEMFNIWHNVLEYFYFNGNINNHILFVCFSNVLIYFLIKSADLPSRMVKLNIDLILGGILSYTKKTRDESLNHFLSRLTHLHLEGRQLDDIVSFSFTLSNSNNNAALPEPLMTRNWTKW